MMLVLVVLLFHFVVLAVLLQLIVVVVGEIVVLVAVALSSVFVEIDFVLLVPLVKLVVELVVVYQNHFCLVLTVHLVGAN